MGFLKAIAIQMSGICLCSERHTFNIDSPREDYWLSLVHTLYSSQSSSSCYIGQALLHFQRSLMFWGHMIANTVPGSSWEGIFTSDLDARNDEFHLMSRIFCCLEVLYVNRADIFHHNLASGHYQAVSSRASLA